MHLDAGAVRAVGKKKSLFASGITARPPPLPSNPDCRPHGARRGLAENCTTHGRLPNTKLILNAMPTARNQKIEGTFGQMVAVRLVDPECCEARLPPLPAARLRPLLSLPPILLPMSRVLVLVLVDVAPLEGNEGHSLVILEGQEGVPLSAPLIRPSGPGAFSSPPTPAPAPRRSRAGL